MLNANCVEIARDDDSQTETLRTHFTGHAFDAHWHDSYLIGITEVGVQQFHSGCIKHQSTPGKVFILAPGEIHDGDAVDGAGFTYRMLYLLVPLMHQTLPALFAEAPNRFELFFPQTLVNDPLLAGATWEAFNALHHQAPRMVRDHALQHLLVRLTHGYPWRKKSAPANVSRLALNRARDYLQTHYHEEIRLDALAHVAGMDRFRLNREFRAAFGLPAPCLAGAVAFGTGQPSADAGRFPRPGRRTGRIRRSDPSGELVPSYLSYDARSLSVLVYKRSRRRLSPLLL